MKRATSFSFNENEIPEWDYFVSEAGVVFNLSETEVKRLNESRTARIIVAIPFAAGCENAERTAILHLCAYIAEIRGFQRFCAHLPSDDRSLYERLKPISQFTGGDRRIIEYGMDMLALIMLHGYKETQKIDAKHGTYNPLNVGAWDFNAAEKMLEGRLKNFHNSILDGIFYSPSSSGWC